MTIKSSLQILVLNIRICEFDSERMKELYNNFLWLYKFTDFILNHNFKM